MMKKRSKFFLMSAVTLVLLTSLIPRAVYGIKGISLVREAEAQEEGGQGMGGIMQSILPMLMMLMMMGMMGKNKGNNLEREQGDAAKNANANLLRAGTQSNSGGNGFNTNSLAPNGSSSGPNGVNFVIPLIK